MGLCVLGTFLNNIAFITIKDLPGVKASTYNVLLGHIVLGRQLVRKSCEKMKSYFVDIGYRVIDTHLA